MKKKKIFKKISLAVLAIVMASGGIFAFAPIGASASTPPPTTTTGLGLDPKNDPVVYTTESGLEIKMSNVSQFSGTSNFITNKSGNVTQDLSGFYYFTMGTYSGTIYTGKTQTDTYTVTNEPVNWIILGVGSHSNAFVESVSNYLFSTIKNNDYLFSNGEYYFDNQHETFSPAGQLINSVVSTKTYIMGKVKDSIKVHTDIPKGCMLVLSEKMLGQMYFNSSGALNYTYYQGQTLNMTMGNGHYGGRYRYKGDKNTMTKGGQTWNNKTGGSLYAYINSLFAKNNSTGAIDGENKLGFTQAQADLIVPQQLYTYYTNNGNGSYQETPSTDGNTFYTMFPLAYRGANSSIYQNFCIEDYLTSNLQRPTTYMGSNYVYAYNLRSGSDYTGYPAASTGGHTGVLGYGQVFDTCGVRPAMVMRLQ